MTKTEWKGIPPVKQMTERTKTALRKVTERITAAVLIFSLACSFCSCRKDNGDFDGKRFSRTRKISVLVDAAVDSATDRTVDNSSTASYIHDRLLDECNVDVTFVESYKLDFHNGIAADISYTKDYNELASYYRMGAVINLSPYLTGYSDALSDLTDLLGPENTYYCNDEPGEIWCLNARDDRPDPMVTFIRSDWLNELGLEAPSDREELYECLKAFRDNAGKLLGDDASRMIPFFIDSEPNVSAKPLFDSCLDPSAGGREIFEYGYCRIGQDGYADGLRILNSWYLEGILPEDFISIVPSSKESYEPIENGYVGAFCANCDYLYANGDNAHIKALRENCGEDADYIAVNTFTDRSGNYTYWPEDYLAGEETALFLPSTCSDPLACLVYLNWISDTENIADIRTLETDDPYTYDRYLLTCRNAVLREDISEDPSYVKAYETALDVKCIHQRNMCVSYGPDIFRFVRRSGTDYSAVYPDSAKIFMERTVCAPAGEFESVLDEQYGIYLSSGTEVLRLARGEEWDKVLVYGDREPRVRN